MNNTRTAIALLVLLDVCALAFEPLYTCEGTDPSFATLLENGGIRPGEKFFEGPVLGSRIRLNHERLEKQLGTIGPEGSLWPCHIDMTAEGEIHFLRRSPYLNGDFGSDQITVTVGPVHRQLDFSQ